MHDCTENTTRQSTNFVHPWLLVRCLFRLLPFIVTSLILSLTLPQLHRVVITTEKQTTSKSLLTSFYLKEYLPCWLLQTHLHNVAGQTRIRQTQVHFNSPHFTVNVKSVMNSKLVYHSSWCFNFECLSVDCPNTQHASDASNYFS
jgi:hypothetical protein